MSLGSSFSVLSKANRSRGRLLRLSAQRLARGLLLLAATLVALSLAGVVYTQGMMEFALPHAHGNVLDSEPTSHAVGDRTFGLSVIVRSLGSRSLEAIMCEHRASMRHTSPNSVTIAEIFKRPQTTATFLLVVSTM